jgi:hypothetical protein
MWLIVPLLIVYYAGELIWREREAGLGEIAGAAPVPVWVSFAGKFAGLALVLVAAQALVMAAAMVVQARMGYYEFEVGLYARVLFGIRLTDYLLFALLALVIHVVVEQKYVGHLIAVIAYLLVAFGSQFGVEPGLLVYGSRADETTVAQLQFKELDLPNAKIQKLPASGACGRGDVGYHLERCAPRVYAGDSSRSRACMWDLQRRRVVHSLPLDGQDLACSTTKLELFFSGPPDNPDGEPTGPLVSDEDGSIRAGKEQTLLVG